MTTRIRLALSLLLIGMSFSCGPGQDPGDSGYLTSGLDRVPGNAQSPETLEQVARNNEFALDMYAQVATGMDTNLFFSPLSISFAMGMVHGGMRGDILPELEAVFGFPATGPHAALNAIEQQVEGTSDATTTVRFENGLFIDPDLHPTRGYLDLLAQYYGLGFHVVPIVADPSGAADVINAWVREVTDGLIEEMILPYNLTDAEFVLLNTLLFKAVWKVEFDPEATWERSFTLTDGTLVRLETMTAVPDTWFRGIETDEMKVVAIPYQRSLLEFVAFMPTTGPLTSLEQQLTPAWLQGVLGSLTAGDHRCPDSLALPKFEVTTRREDLFDVLALMGVESLVTEAYDYFGLVSARSLPTRILRIIQESKIKVNEGGTEAASATAVIGGGADGGVIGDDAGPVCTPRHFILDRPFFYLIRETTTGSILFMGKFVGR